MNYKIIIGLIILISGIYANFYVNNYWTEKYFRGEPNHHDILIEKTDFKDYSSELDILVLGLMFYGSILVVKKLYSQTPKILAVFGTYQWLRAACIFLTPIPPPDYVSWGLLQKLVDEVAVFPSGHISVPTLFMLIFWNQKMYVPALINGLGIILIFAGMIVSRGHYSIDLIAGILFSYAIYTFFERNISKRAKREKGFKFPSQ